MVNYELRRQVINVYKGKTITSQQRKYFHGQSNLYQNFFGSDVNTPWDTHISETDSIVRLRDKRISKMRSRFGKGSRGRNL